MNLSDILKLKFPGIDLIDQVQVFDDGQGAYIKKWDKSLGELPTEKDLLQWEQEVEPQRNKLQADLLNKPIVDKLQALDLKSIRALREGNKDRLVQLEVEATELRKGLIK